jgi:ABC-type bacteriocin/lantibiotic exporter with double-glycine peptidase domain
MTFLQVTLPIIDVIGIFLFGFLLQSLLVGDSVKSQKIYLKFENEITKIIHLNHQQYLLFLASASAVLFISKGFFSIVVNANTYRSLSKASLEFSSQVSLNFFNGDMATVQHLPSARVGAALNDSVNNKIVSILGAFGALVGELTLIASICGFLFFYNGLLTMVSILYFLIVFIFLQKYLSKITSSLAKIRGESDENIRSLISESIGSYRELFVLDAIPKLLEKYNDERAKAAHAQSNLYWLVNLPKYVYESVLIIGIVVLVAINLLFSSADNFQMTVATFLIAGARVLPSILRVQNLLNLIEYSSSSSIFLEEVMGLKSKKIDFEQNRNSNPNFRTIDKPEFIPTVDISNLSFSYLGHTKFELLIDSLKIDCGERIALVGESGSGKSTFADLILGVLEPDHGLIEISSMRPAESIKTFKGKIGYVPQSANLFSTDIFGNIAPYELRTEGNIVRAWICLEMAQLESFVKQLPSGLNTSIGERGY